MNLLKIVLTVVIFSIGNLQIFSDATICEPDSKFRIDCDICRCSQDGTQYSCSTRRCEQQASRYPRIPIPYKKRSNAIFDDRELANEYGEDSILYADINDAAEDRYNEKDDDNEYEPNLSDIFLLNSRDKSREEDKQINDEEDAFIQ